MSDPEAPLAPPAAPRVMICPHCDWPAIQEVKGQAEEPPEDPADEASPLSSEFTLLQCANCHKVSLQLRDIWFFDSPNEVPQFVYPARRQLSDDIPEKLRQEFGEARTCFDTKAYTATVVMVRRTLEGIAANNGITERNLVRQISKMRDQGLIDTSIADWADGLRVLGNQGAHYTGRKVSREDANDALDFAEALLDHIYVYKRRFEEFKKRRDAKLPHQTGTH
ncbi:DUF4145 domain-containing protein [Micromonospora tulbaghiae]|uniref:DUF4145 domain-containing protein n=1 Tax=Micromonospora tulbaghiae TaxID=479978 RepID=UPI0010759F46